MMALYRTLRTALRALRRNVLRSGLTALGIVIGVAAVIAMEDIGQGSARAMQKNIEAMGANNLLIQPGAASSGGVSVGTGSIVTLTPQDADAIARDCPAVESVAPIVRARTQVIYGSKNWVPAYLYGTTPAFLDIRDWTDMADGDCFTDRDVRNTAGVCLIGQTVVKNLFGDDDPIGEEIRVQSVRLKVIGVLSRKGANMMGIDQDDIVLAPWTTIKFRVTGVSAATANQSNNVVDPMAINTLNNRYPNLALTTYLSPTPTQVANTPQPIRVTNVDQILTRAESDAAIPDAIRQISALLHERHHIRPGQPDDFNIRDMTEISKTMSSNVSLINALLLAVATISLMVGGVGIMNIMLVSVTERTREIGLRMAVGAKAIDILRQFLTEAVILCALGGIIGIVLGRVVSILAPIREFNFGLFTVPGLGWPTQFSPGATVVAFLVSAGVGIVFGFYPAWRASKLDPIEALRYE
jgi:ABC-type antimicrobial peptide transport system permease subunit